MFRIRQWILASKIVRQISFQKATIGEGNQQVNLQNLLESVAEEKADVMPLKQRIAQLEESITELEKKVKTREIELQEKNEIISNLKNQLATVGSSTSAISSPPTREVNEEAQKRIAQLTAELESLKTETAKQIEEIKSEAEKRVEEAKRVAIMTTTSTQSETKQTDAV